jgi:hypothetical protein
MKQDTTRRRNVKLLEKLGIEQRQLHHFLQLVDVALQATNLTEVDSQVDTEWVCVS